ncbi:MAG TPA: sigma-54 dependent transcriptional regulator [Cytophagaceae bacterium]|jgi:transcriptional regulator with PAS, ATPase and Fis domain|nr:sigma-54 dependent transcriptional regulator [Cytophagaceae bacterium]
MSAFSQEIQSIKLKFGIIGSSPALNHAIQVAVQVAPTDMSVLITGESGSGKESFSKIIHSLSARKHGKFIAINCGAIPEGTIDSELFGHEKGSFTGAHEARKGYFEETDAGTIFLDEIGEMPLGTQARLLRVLENKEFIKVGSSKVQKTDVRVIAATNVNLFEAVQKGKFREDLYYRLNTVPIYVPPLRERGSDIELLFRKFASDFADRYKVAPIKLTEEAKELLVRYRFPGNIRQLKNIAEQISVLETDRTVTKEQLFKYLPELNTPTLPALSKGNGAVEDFSEREILYKILFDMKKDMNELKKLVYEVLQNENYGTQVLNNHQELFHNMAHTESTADEILKNSYLIQQKENTQPIIISDKVNDHDEIHDVEEVESEDESLSLNVKEKEMIIKALKKNNNKRKYAAQDLGISERTLYRKIKEYNLEE